ncbi:MAG TPA: peptide deformylase [Acidimicrobiaceae bacterium]|nr:peptide deformylase [Acidimicrobiaceae bacterium]HAZ56938.1 peptide deformylase [Acidimicrobiaceae bacterium]HIE68202.1 peptide deformylase [Acidimicrobiia bacterium]HIL48414.1 peptide deformylase [Acidimicrobiia bacterium]
MAPHQIRLIGDPVLRRPATDVTDVDGALVRLTDDMFTTMYEAPGIGLAAPQVGVQKRFFVYDHGEGAGVILNPRIIESDGEWTFEEGCLSIPDLTWEITRPKQIHLVGVDLDGNEVSIEADEIEARLFQHEIDHLDGILLVDHLDEDQAREARRALREMTMSRLASTSAGGQLDGGLRLR